tara:strand:- start:1641 stop:1976 length:336 start_codon:yes stop_codon:yes gene_type:complete
METDNKSSILAFIIAIPLILCLLMSSVSAQKLYTGGEKYEKSGVVALLLHLNGKMIEWVYKENIGQCLKSKRVASREVGGERVIFSCKLVKGLLQEDKQSKYGIRLLKVLD